MSMATDSVVPFTTGIDVFVVPFCAVVVTGGEVLSILCRFGSDIEAELSSDSLLLQFSQIFKFLLSLLQLLQTAKDSTGTV